MQIQQVNRVDAEKVFILVKNVDGSGSITTGMGAQLTQLAASFDGVSSVKSAAALYNGFMGIAVQDIAINAFGLVQNWGFCNSVQVSGVGSSLSVQVGNYLIPGAVAGQFFSSLTDQALSTLLYRYAINATATMVSANPSFTSAFIKAL